MFLASCWVSKNELNIPLLLYSIFLSEPITVYTLCGLIMMLGALDLVQRKSGKFYVLFLPKVRPDGTSTLNCSTVLYQKVATMWLFQMP